MTVQVMWKVPAWRLILQWSQESVIIQIASQGIFTKCSSFQISHQIVTVKLTPLWCYLQLDHPVTCENIKCYSHIQIVTRVKSYNLFNNLLPSIVLQREKGRKVLEIFYATRNFVMNVYSDGNKNICEVTWAITCKQTIMKYDKFNLTQLNVESKIWLTCCWVGKTSVCFSRINLATTSVCNFLFTQES